MLNQPIPLVNEIHPKPKTVLEFYEGHPERWMKGHPGALDCNGRTTANVSNAVSLCLGRAFGFIYYIPVESGLPWDERWKEYNEAEKRMTEVLQRQSGNIVIIDYNDSEVRTFDDIVRVCREARI